MKQTVEVLCQNNGQRIEVPVGSTLNEIYPEFNLDIPFGPISAKVNNKVEGMDFCLYNNKTVEYLDMTTSSGSRAYTRTLFFVLCKAVDDMYPGANVIIDTPVSNGYYINLKLGRPVQKDDVDSIRSRMQQIINASLPVKKHEGETEEADGLFCLAFVLFHRQ